MLPGLQEELTAWVERNGVGLPTPVVRSAMITQPEPDVPAVRSGEEIPDKRVIIGENDRFLLYMNPPEREHNPAHVHLLMKTTPEFEAANGKQKARFALVQSKADIFRDKKEDARYAVTMPYYNIDMELKENFGEHSWHIHPEEGEGKGLPLVNSYRFNLAGIELQEALDFVNQHIDDCIATWTELYRDTPEEHDFITPDLLEGVNYARRIERADLSPRGSRAAR